MVRTRWTTDYAPGPCNLPDNYTFNGDDAGIHLFSATLGTSGVQSITRLTLMSSLTATVTNIEVT